MTLDEFFSWLSLTDLEAGDSETVVEILESVLDDLPEDPMLDEFAELLEDCVDSEDFHPRDLAGVPSRFSHLRAESASPLTQVEDAIERLARELSPEQVHSARLGRFEEILRAFDEEPDEAQEAALSEELTLMEHQMRAVWEEYSSGTVTEEEVSAESVAGHRFLEEGFHLWFQAFEQARELELDEAWEQACEGNRLLSAVSLWSDGLRSGASAEIGSG